MKVRLLRDTKIRHSAGEIVEVSPTEFQFLVSLGSAEPVIEARAAAETPEAAKPKRTTRKKSTEE